MARWQFLITPQAEDDLAEMDSPVRKRVVERLAWFVEHFEEVSPLPLGGNWKGFFKLRAGELADHLRSGAEELSNNCSWHRPPK
jgi:hypothetical protein